jgi:hypothetical protein
MKVCMKHTSVLRKALNSPLDEGLGGTQHWMKEQLEHACG